MGSLQIAQQQKRLGRGLLRCLSVSQNEPTAMQLRLSRRLASKAGDENKDLVDHKHKSENEACAKAAKSNDGEKEPIGFDAGFRDGYQAGFDLGRKFASDVYDSIEKDYS